MANEAKRKSLMNQYSKLEDQYDALMDNIPKGGLSKKDDDERRRLQKEMVRIGSMLGGMTRPDTQNP